MTRQRFDELVGLALDSQLTPAESDELARMAAADRSLRLELYSQLSIAEALSQLQAPSRAAGQFCDAADARVASETGKYEFMHRILDVIDKDSIGEDGPPATRLGSLFRFRTGRFQSARFALATVVCAAIAVASLLFLRPQPAGKVAGSPPASVGTLTRSANVQWAAGAYRWSVGDALAAGQAIKFDSGRVELQFDSGALMTVVGPAALEIQSAKLVALRSGTATTRVDAQNGGEFRVVTPVTEVLDLGTEFGVRVRPDGQTDVVVFEGKVDVTPVATAEGRSQVTQTLSVGEAVCVNEAGGWRRVMAVDSDAFPFGDEMFRLSRGRRPVIVGVSDDLRPSDNAKFYRICHAGFGEDVRAYVDRVHEWNGLTEEGIPEFLRGADYVATFNDDSKRESREVPSRITVELSGPATLYVFYHNQFEIPDWLSESFENTGAVLGLDEGPSRFGETTIGAGPGNSIDGVCTVWRRRIDAARTVDLGAVGRLSPDPQRGRAMYGIAAQPL